MKVNLALPILWVNTRPLNLLTLVLSKQDKINTLYEVQGDKSLEYFESEKITDLTGAGDAKDGLLETFVKLLK